MSKESELIELYKQKCDLLTQNCSDYKQIIAGHEETEKAMTEMIEIQKRIISTLEETVSLLKSQKEDMGKVIDLSDEVIKKHEHISELNKAIEQLKIKKINLN